MSSKIYEDAHYIATIFLIGEHFPIKSVVYKYVTTQSSGGGREKQRFLYIKYT